MNPNAPEFHMSYSSQQQAPPFYPAQSYGHNPTWQQMQYIPGQEAQFYQYPPQYYGYGYNGGRGGGRGRGRRGRGAPVQGSKRYTDNRNGQFPRNYNQYEEYDNYDQQNDVQQSPGKYEENSEGVIESVSGTSIVSEDSENSFGGNPSSGRRQKSYQGSRYRDQQQRQQRKALNSQNSDTNLLENTKTGTDDARKDVTENSVVDNHRYTNRTVSDSRKNYANDNDNKRSNFNDTDSRRSNYNDTDSKRSNFNDADSRRSNYDDNSARRSNFEENTTSGARPKSYSSQYQGRRGGGQSYSSSRRGDRERIKNAREADLAEKTNYTRGRNNYSDEKYDDIKNDSQDVRTETKEDGPVKGLLVLNKSAKAKFDETQDNKQKEEVDPSVYNRNDKRLFQQNKSSFHNRNVQHKAGARKFKNQNVKEDDETQRGSLIEQLSNNSYECMVCCEIVRREVAIWSCSNCYHVYHLRCIKRWARMPATTLEESTGWRCPACQNVNQKIPNQYRCFCGKVRDPDNTRYETPHSCGDNCGKKRSATCPHRCNILCHPGPCPSCQATVIKHCNCGKVKMTVKCGQSADLKCEAVCSKTLNCGRHECQRVCHAGQCEPCEETVKQVCYCGQTKREVVCGTTESFVTSFSCDNTCSRPLDCGNHHCTSPCHPGTCKPCSLSPAVITHCCCGQTPLEELDTPPRTECTDPIPICDRVCCKRLMCGPEVNRHTCKQPCHTGDCSPCDGESTVTCRCGRYQRDVTCVEAVEFTDANPLKCDVRCNKKRDCGRHKCGQLCCVDTEHKCEMICGKKLTCGLHKCEEPCHRGNCANCWQVSFSELTCYCGAEVLYPPIPCATRPPECKNTCIREHPCGHPVRHNCHCEENCPPCTELTQKWCFGGHEKRKNIPCHITEVSCGKPCGKPLSCGVHFCKQPCHKGSCSEECKQLCILKRPECGHPCNSLCHVDTPCPNLPCKAPIVVKCECGLRSEKTTCNVGEDKAQEQQRLASTMLAMRMADGGGSVDISNLTKESAKKPRRLECNSECAIQERNKRLALALEIKNPDLSSKLGNPTYTDFLRGYAKNHSTFVSSIESALSKLVTTAQQSKQRSRSHAFKPMNMEQRKVVHELAEYYGCTSQSYDEEPKKNVVATAQKDKCWQPNVTLTAFVQREIHPKAPMPIPLNSKEEDIRSQAKASKQSLHVLGEWKSKPTTLTKLTPKPSTLTKLSSNGPKPWLSSKSKPPEEPPEPISTTPWKAISKGWSQASSAPPGATPWGGASGTSRTSSASKPKEPVIDYFEMTD